ncbi:FANCONI ANEMIA GROUP E PROTEIN [Salix koriyanagi]|uniref:FANCONI ANEMIA GROUP E PROTEIN n=1 Tax=Salix koriyanagi TaxID=2511006 RepID=A0A9Q0VF22_9ROSI|nr:FANCONI ANEMIA GROUP E PROTEIN [Salix koriyanagi]
MIHSSSTNSICDRRVMFLQTLPFLVQSRILSFLCFDHRRFCKRDLSMLARTLLTETEENDFWVKRAARNLLDKVSDSNYQWISGLSLDSGKERVGEEFGSIPDFLTDAASSANELFLPWLPLSHDTLSSRELFAGYESPDLLSQVGEDADDNSKDVAEEMEIDLVMVAPLDEEIQNMATSLKERIMTFESSSKTIELANEIRRLSLERKADPFVILGLLEPWKADDETASILIFHLSNGREEEEIAWPSQVLCSIMLPKMLVLEEPASRVLVIAMVEYCKLYQRAAECALLFPLIMKRSGINNHMCDVITRIVKESLHPAHVSAFCRKLLCGQEVEKRSIILPCHQCLVSSQLVWTESLFNLFQNILNHNVQLTQDSIDQLVLLIIDLAPSFSKSLKFGNFLLCFITRCSLVLKSRKPLLIEAVAKTNTLVTKSILSKLASF